MRIINVKGLTLQFDLESGFDPTEDMVKAQIEIINAILSEQCSWSQPQLVIGEEMEAEAIEFIDPEL